MGFLESSRNKEEIEDRCVVLSNGQMGVYRREEKCHGTLTKRRNRWRVDDPL